MKQPTRPGKIVSRYELREILGLSKQRVAVIVEHDDFPRPIDAIMGGRTPLWRRADIDRWLKQREPAADGAAVDSGQ